MEQPTYKVYKYRWVVLIVYMLIVAMNQLLWITFAPITSEATRFYHVSDIWIGVLSMSFMIVYILVSIPASWIIDTYGIKTGVGIGALLTGIFGLSRGFVKDDFQLLLICQVGIAIGQPFILNSITMLAARWFPLSERATASGLGTLSMYIGILAGIAVTPYLSNTYGIEGMLRLYGTLAVVAAVLFLLFAGNKPPTAPCPPGQEERALVFDGLKLCLNNKGFIWLMIIFFIGLGVFNAVTTWIENILMPRGFTAIQAGMTGGLMIIGGILGAVVMPLLSDHFRRRTPFILLALAGATLGLAGITFASQYWVLLTSGAVLGFFLLSSGPIGFQYGAEITYPVSEGTSNGLLLLVGQVSGIAFIFGMDFFRNPLNGSMTQPLLVLTGLMVISFLMAFRLKESPMLTRDSSVKTD